MLLQEVKGRKKNLAMGRTDYRKAYEMVPHSWVIESLNMMSMAKNVVDFLGKAVKSWRVNLTIKRRILQGDALSPLLFVIVLIPLTHILRTANPGYEFRFMDDFKLYSKSEKALDSLIQTVRIFSKEFGMHFGIDKCTMLVMKKGKIVIAQ